MATYFSRAALLLLVLSGMCLGQGRYSRTRGSSSRNPPTNSAIKDLTGTFHGVLKQISKKELVILTPEDQTVVIRLSKGTKFLKSGREVKASNLDLDTPVAVDVNQDIDLKPIALSVTVETPAKWLVAKAHQDWPNCTREAQHLSLVFNVLRVGTLPA